MDYTKVTETPSNHDNLEQLDTTAILQKMNEEDKKVADVVSRCIPQITKLVDALAERFEKGGRLFYIGAGTSGRLGILDASEIPPTYGMPHERVVGLIAGGDTAIRKSVEHAEDNRVQAWVDLMAHEMNESRDAMFDYDYWDDELEIEIDLEDTLADKLDILMTDMMNEHYGDPELINETIAYIEYLEMNQCKND